MTVSIVTADFAEMPRNRRTSKRPPALKLCQVGETGILQSKSQLTPQLAGHFERLQAGRVHLALLAGSTAL